MKLEQQVVSLELAKKLEKLGVRDNTLFYWVEDKRDKRKPFKAMSKARASRIISREATITPAFTVAELGEKLPNNCKSFKGGKDFYWACELKRENGYTSKSGSATEADARAKMLIYILENKLIET